VFLPLSCVFSQKLPEQMSAAFPCHKTKQNCVTFFFLSKRRFLVCNADILKDIQQVNKGEPYPYGRNSSIDHPRATATMKCAIESSVMKFVLMSNLLNKYGSIEALHNIFQTWLCCTADRKKNEAKATHAGELSHLGSLRLMPPRTVPSSCFQIMTYINPSIPLE
jgi:hypothetical protein